MAIRNMRLDFVDSLANDLLFSYLCMYIITYRKNENNQRIRFQDEHETVFGRRHL